MNQVPGHQMGEWAVALTGVTKMFGEVTAVDDASLTIADGEFFSLLGPSGCGKTTILRLIAGFEQPSAGELYLHGQPVAGIPPYRRPVNTVFQSYALFPHMTVAQNIAFGLEMKKMPRPEIERRVAEVLALVQLPALGQRRPKQLSGGQQQRVALARALVNQPEVLLLDEPLGALDLKLRKAMQLELKQIQQEVGITFLYVTHDQEEALTMSDRIAVMSQGIIQQIGEPRQIYEYPANRFVADFIGETNFLAGTVLAAGDPATLEVGGQPLLGSAHGRELQAGQAVTVALRPEKVRLYPRRDEQRLEKTWLDLQEFNALVGHPIPAGQHLAAEQQYVVLDGRVRDAIYIGTDTRYVVELPGEMSLQARSQNFGAQADTHFAPGDAVYVHWLAGNAQILTD